MAANDKGEDGPPFGLRGSALTVPADTYICPYNTRHEIREDQINKHLAKCRLNYVLNLVENGEAVWPWAFCKYNEEHYMFGPELLFHEAICKDQWKYVLDFNLNDISGYQNAETDVDQQMELEESGAEEFQRGEISGSLTL